MPMPLTTSAIKLAALIQWVMRTSTEWRGASRTVASWIARPGRYADCAIAIAENLARGNARNNIFELAFAVIGKEIVKTMVGILVHGNNHYILKPKLCRASLVAGEFVYIEEVLRRAELIYGR